MEKIILMLGYYCWEEFDIKNFNFFSFFQTLLVRFTKYQKKYQIFWSIGKIWFGKIHREMISIL